MIVRDRWGEGHILLPACGNKHPQKIKKKEVETIMSNKKRIVFYLTDEEYKLLSRRAQECTMSINAFAKQKALDETDSVKLKRGAAFVMAELYRFSEITEDLTAREQLKWGGDWLCRCLK